MAVYARSASDWMRAVVLRIERGGDGENGVVIEVFGVVGVELFAWAHFAGHRGERVGVAQDGDLDLAGVGDGALDQDAPVEASRFEQAFVEVGTAAAFGDADRGAQVDRFDEERVGGEGFAGGDGGLDVVLDRGAGQV